MESQSYTLRYLDEISEKQENERQSLLSSGLKLNIKANITLDIRKDFNSEKEFKNYMESKFLALFGEDESDLSDEDGSSNRHKRSFLQW